MIKHYIKDHIAVVTLSREGGLNALSSQMLEDLLKIYRDLENNDDVKIVVLNSDRRDFCAGGDLKEVYESFSKCKDRKCLMSYFTKEYDLDLFLATTKKPTITFWTGVSMGGGVGLTMHSSIIIADKTVRFAMPETKLGIVPDVGVGTVLSKIDRPTANYITLNSKIISASDIKHLGIVDYLVEKSETNEILDELFKLANENNSTEEIMKDFKETLKDYSIPTKKTELTFNEEKINKYYDKDSVFEIVKALKEDKDDEFAKTSLEELENVSPYSMVLQFEKLKAGEKWDRVETLKRDWLYILDSSLRGDFEEGIRSVLIDKDNNPNWKHKTLEEVDMDEIHHVLYERETKYN